mgnify:CR=1 FL=1
MLFRSDKLVQGEDFSTAAGAAAETFLAAEVMRWAGGAVKSIVGGGAPVPMPAHDPHDDDVEVDGWSPEDEKLTGPARYNAQLQKLVRAHPQYPHAGSAPDVAPAAPEPDASKLPGGDTSMNDREVRSANMQQASNDMAKQPAAAEPETPAATPRQTAYDQLASMKNPRVQRALTDVQDQIEKEMVSYKGADYLEHFRKLASNQLDLKIGRAHV